MLSEFENIRLMQSVVCERIVFRRAAISGMAVTEYRPEDAKASQEMLTFYREVFNEQE